MQLLISKYFKLNFGRLSTKAGRGENLVRAGIKDALPKPDLQEEGAKELFREIIVDTQVINSHRRDLVGQRRASLGVMVNNRRARIKDNLNPTTSFDHRSQKRPHSIKKHSFKSKGNDSVMITEDLLYACALSLAQDRPHWLVGLQA